MPVIATRERMVCRKGGMERLAIIKERYHKLILRQRQEIEKELQEDLELAEELDGEVETEAVPATIE